MSSLDRTTVLGIRITQLTDPSYRRLLLEYAGTYAVPCVAEALMKCLRG